MSDIETVQKKIQELEQMLLACDPQLPSHLKNIHSTLLNYPELSALLNPKEVGTIVEGLVRTSGEALKVSESKKRTSSKNLTLDLSSL